MLPEETRAISRPMRSSRNQRAYQVRDLWEKSNTSERIKWQVGEQVTYDFVLNSQLTQEEEEALRRAGMPTFIVNRMTPVLETMKYFVTANSPKYKAVGVDGTDSKMAEIHTGMLDYGWYISDGKAMLGQTVFNSLVKSKGYFHVYIDPDADRGLGEVKIETVDPFCVWTSPMSSDYMERDATYQIIKKDISREALVKMLPEFSKKIKAANGIAYTSLLTSRGLQSSDSIQANEVNYSWKSNGEEDDILPYYEMYEPFNIKLWNVYVRPTIAIQEMAAYKAEADNELGVLQQELAVSLKEKEVELQSLLEEGKIIKERANLEIQKAANDAQITLETRKVSLYSKAEDASKRIEEYILTEKEFEEIQNTVVEIVKALPFYERRFKKTCVIGDKLLYESVIKCSHSPLIALPYLHTSTPYPMSAGRPLIGKQQEINKAHQIMIHNANVSSNFRWKYIEGEIDLSVWEDRVSAPSALLPYRPIESGSRGPEAIFPQPINNAFFTVEESGKADLEYMAGIHPPSMGMSTGGADETYRGFLAKDEFSTRRIKSWVSNVLEPVLEHLGRVYQEIAQDTYDIHKVLKIVQPSPSGGLQEVAFEINIPVYDDFGKEVAKYNDYNSSRYDLRIVAGSTLPLNRWAIMEEYKQYLQLGVIDDVAFLMETDIRDKDNILKRKSMMSEMRGQLEGMETAIKERDGTIETLSRQLTQMKIDAGAKDAVMEINRDKTETKMIEKLTQERMRDELKKLRMKIDLIEQSADLALKEGELDKKSLELKNKKKE